MNKYLLSLLFLLVACTAMAQKDKPSRITIQKYATIVYNDPNDLTIVHKATFQQDFSTLTSDSAYFHPKKNTFEAFGHVVITQGDTLHIYGDKLNYDGNSKIAIMTDHVKLVDKDATLTTNYFVYNTATRIGTYTGGGKLVNADNTLTSKNGFYFANSRDAYFRYNVVMNTVDAIIKTDTMRYNSGTKINYFYGPTHIYGKKNKDTLYTENGTYNTNTEQAFFGKKNLYSQGTKSLKGDSLFYDRLANYGRALKHVVFNDNEQKVTLYGDKGVYTKADERTVMTENAYVVMVTVDSAKRDTVTAKAATKPGMGTTKTPPPNTIKRVDTNIKAGKTDMPKPLDSLNNARLKKDTIKNKPKIDSVFLAADTIATWTPIFKDLKVMQQQYLLAGQKDATQRKIVAPPYTKAPKEILIYPPHIVIDTISHLHLDYFPKPPRDTTQHVVIKPIAKKKPATKINLATRPMPIDSVNLVRKISLNDTAKVRIIMAYHNAKIYKSDLQAKADSIFYSYADSTARMYVNPMVWSNGSQLSGDTINLQFANKKVDNVTLAPHAFVVNIAKNDSTHFNQVGGRKMRGYFKDGKIDKIFVDGNAETVYYNRDSLTHPIEILRTVSSRIRVNFAKGELTSTTFTVKPDTRDVPLATAKEEDKVLRGFIWKPKDRPVSKESIIPSTYLARPGIKKTTAKTTTGKRSGQKPEGNGTARSTRPAVKTPADSTLIKRETLKRPKPDTLKRPAILPGINTANE